jgi:hypothetical protein
MDSGLEAFLRKHEKPRNAREPAVVKKLRESKQKKYIAAENLANAVVKKREALEARSSLFNAGPMHISGSGVNYMQAIPENSALDNIHPGLVQMRAHEIKRRGPTIKDFHDTKTHELLTNLQKTMEDQDNARGLSSMVRHDELLDALRGRGRGRSRSAASETSVGSSLGSGILQELPEKVQKEHALASEASGVKSTLDKYPREIIQGTDEKGKNKIHVRYTSVPSGHDQYYERGDPTKTPLGRDYLLTREQQQRRLKAEHKAAGRKPDRGQRYRQATAILARQSALKRGEDVAETDYNRYRPSRKGPEAASGSAAPKKEAKRPTTTFTPVK